MKTHYLIDFENVHEDGLRSLPAGEGDTIYLFYTQNAAKIGLDALSEITAKICVIKVAAGKQSLDMHLICYFGYLMNKYGREDRYIIVSNDTDFDSVISHWSREHDFPNILRLGTGKMSDVFEPVEDNEFIRLLTAGGTDPQTAASVFSIVNKYRNDENPKQPIYRALIKKFGQKAGLVYYNLIRKEI